MAEQGVGDEQFLTMKDIEKHITSFHYVQCEKRCKSIAMKSKKH